jgi:hypothetical protein
MHYSFREPFSILSNMSITFNTNQNTYTVYLLCGSKTCRKDEACVQNMCIHRNSLRFVARWSSGRKGQGWIIIRTPLNNTIYFRNLRTKSFVNRSQVDEIYQPSNSILPKGFYNICFNTGSLLTGTNRSSITVTIEIRQFRQEMKIITRTFNRSTKDLSKCIDTSDTFVGSYSTGMFSPRCDAFFK